MEKSAKNKVALISVFHKDNLEDIIRKLDELNYTILSTGGTQKFIESLGVKVVAVEDITGYPSILGGRVKTLHPKVFGGILSRRDNELDNQQLVKYDISAIDVVIVDLYPFERTVELGSSEQEIIEKIDIGGISLIRAAAKNYKDVLVVPSQQQYQPFLKLLEETKGNFTIEQKKQFATKAFAVSSRYDVAIFNYFADEQETENRVILSDGKTLRYGENPHQNATFYKLNNVENGISIADAKMLQGKPLSYNNMLDADAAWKSASDAYHSVSHIDKKVSVSVVKHLNPCGLAVSNSIIKSLELAWAGDPISAFGSIVCFTSKVNKEVAECLSKKFVEILIAPDFSDEALEVLSKKKNLRLLVLPIRDAASKETIYRSISGGMLMQDEDEQMDADFKVVTKTHFDENKINLAKFGVVAGKHLKSNAIALVTEYKDGSFWLTGAGMGQPNRLDSLQQLTMPRFELKNDVEIENSILISDAFFPFKDSIEVANKYQIKYIVEPGGSIRDQEVIDECNKNNIAMVFTGKRHFRH